MSKKTFTPEQKRELLANQYTKLVGSHYIRFTDAFWQEFGRRILAGRWPKHSRQAMLRITW